MLRRKRPQPANRRIQLSNLPLASVRRDRKLDQHRPNFSECQHRLCRSQPDRISPHAAPLFASHNPPPPISVYNNKHRSPNSKRILLRPRAAKLEFHRRVHILPFPQFPTLSNSCRTKQMLSLQPIVTVTATTASTPSQPLTDVLSPHEAAFVMGVFQAPAASAAAAALAFVPPFVLPGTTISPQIFPVGMIVTGIWMFFFVGVVGAGTLGRLQFRHAYRRKARLDAWQAGSGAATVPKAAVGYEKR